MSMKLKSNKYIDTKDIEQLIAPARWNECEFAQTVGNNGYARLDCSDAALKKLYESLDCEVRSGNEPNPEDYDDFDEYEWEIERCYATRLRNQIALVEYLRKNYGIIHEILVWIRRDMDIYEALEELDYFFDTLANCGDYGEEEINLMGEIEDVIYQFARKHEPKVEKLPMEFTCDCGTHMTRNRIADGGDAEFICSKCNTTWLLSKPF